MHKNRTGLSHDMESKLLFPIVEWNKWRCVLNYFNLLRAECIPRNNKIHFISFFVSFSFYHFWIVQVVGTLSQESRGQFILNSQCQLMTWRRNESGHQQPWYWLYRYSNKTSILVWYAVLCINFHKNFHHDIITVRKLSCTNSSILNIFSAEMINGVVNVNCTFVVEQNMEGPFPSVHNNQCCAVSCVKCPVVFLFFALQWGHMSIMALKVPAMGQISVKS